MQHFTRRTYSLSMCHIVLFLLVTVISILVGIHYTTDVFYVKKDRMRHHIHASLSDEDIARGLGTTGGFDYVVVGAGSAGSVVAHRLSANGTFSVLLLEAGPSDANMGIAMPAAWSALMQSPLDWTFWTIPQKHSYGKSYFWPRGKTLGGCSSTNAMMYVRGHRSDYDNWKCKGWEYESVLPYFRKSERLVSKRLHNSLSEEEIATYHGLDGPWTIGDPAYVHPITETFVQAGSRAMGYPVARDYNGENQDGFSVSYTNIHKGERVSAADAFLCNETLQRKNFVIRTNAHVTRVLFEDISNPKRATGVEYRNTLTNKLVRVRTNSEVILSAGAVQTPQILMLSGLGPKEHLSQHKIPLVQDLPGVGSNLHDHLISGILLNTTGKSITLKTEERLDTLYDWIWNRDGPLNSNAAEAMGFVQTEISKKHKLGNIADTQFIFIPALIKSSQLAGAPHIDMEGDAATLAFGLVKPLSRGELRLKSADPMDYPVIDPHYFENEHDVERMVEAFKMSRKIAIEMGAESHNGEVALDGIPNTTEDEHIREYLRRYTVTLFHPVGTCKMSSDPNDTMAVVDERLRVRGMTGLRVIDASVIPEIMNGNTNAPTIMIGEKGADLVLYDKSE